MEKLLIVCLLFCLGSVESQEEDCIIDFGVTATCNPEVPLTVIPDHLPNTIRIMSVLNHALLD